MGKIIRLILVVLIAIVLIGPRLLVALFRWFA